MSLTLLLSAPENARIEDKPLASDPPISHFGALKSLLIVLRFLVATSFLSTGKKWIIIREQYQSGKISSTTSTWTPGSQ